MSRMSLSFDGGDCWVRTRPLMDGSIRPSGIDLNYIVVPLQGLFRRVAQHAESDVADPWVYGTAPNRHVLEAMIKYSHEEGLASRSVALEELFAAESFVSPAVGAAA